MNQLECFVQVLEVKSKLSTSESYGEIQNQFRWENLMIWGHKALICGEMLAQSLCTFGSLIRYAAGVCRERLMFAAAQLSTIIRTDCKILCKEFCWVVYFFFFFLAGHTETMLPRRLFCPSASYQWQHSVEMKRRLGEAGQPFMLEQWINIKKGFFHS